MDGAVSLHDRWKKHGGGPSGVADAELGSIGWRPEADARHVLHVMGEYSYPWINHLIKRTTNG